MSGEENLGNLRVYIHELDRKMICPCKVFVICEEHRTLNGLVSVSATARVKIYHVPPDVMQAQGHYQQDNVFRRRNG